MKRKIVLGEDFTTEVSEPVMSTSYACDMQRCMLGNSVYVDMLKVYKAGSFSVSAIASGVIVEMDGLEHEYCFDRLTLTKINLFDETYESAIAEGATEEDAHARARASVKPFRAKATHVQTRTKRRLTQADRERYSERASELLVGRKNGTIPAPTPRPPRAKKKGRRVIRMGFSAKKAA